MQYPHLAWKQFGRCGRKGRWRKRLSRDPQLQTFLQLFDFLTGKIAPQYNTEQSSAEPLRSQGQQSTAHFVDHLRADLGLTDDLQMNRIPPARNGGRGSPVPPPKKDAGPLPRAQTITPAPTQL